MKERPILFSAPMVCAILDGSKTQTRRIVRYPRSWLSPYAGGDKKLAFALFHTECVRSSFWNCGNPEGGENHWQCGDERLPQNYQVGNRLWVKETFQLCEWFQDHWEPAKLRTCCQSIHKFYAADGVLPDQSELRWRPSIFMPRWASRITLEIISIRVERLHDISEEDARAEGVAFVPCYVSSSSPLKQSYRDLWESIHGKGSWSLNPWVWVLSFKTL